MSAPAIVVDGLVKTFGRDVRALDGVSLEVEHGTVLGLLGPNGAGKTTTVDVLTTLLRPDAGRAQVAGIDGSAIPGRYAGRSAWPASTPRLTTTSPVRRT